MTLNSQTHTRTSARFGRHAATILLLFLAVFLLYALIPTHTGYFTRDPVHYALRLERGTSPTLFFEPNHLLYSPLAQAVFDLFQSLGWAHGILPPLQILSALAGALGVSLFFWLVLRVTQDRKVALFAAALLAFSYGYWRYALEATAYPLSSLFMVAFLLLAVALHSRPTVSLTLLLGLANALAVLFLQSAVLLIPSALAAITLAPASRRARAGRSALYLLTLGLVVGIPYTIVSFGVLRLRTLDTLLTYLLKDAGARAGWYGFGALSTMTPLKILIGFGNLWIGEVFALDWIASTDSLRRAVTARMPDVPLPPAFWVNGDPFRFAALGLLALVVAASILLLLLYAVRHRQRLWSEYRELLVTCLAWITPFSALAVYLRPETVHVWIPILAPVCLIVAIILQDAQRNLQADRHLSQRSLGFLASAFLVALFSLNFFGSILPAHDANSNWTLRMAVLLEDWADEDDLLLALGAGEFKHLPPHVMYYTGSRVITMRGWLLGEYTGETLDRWIRDTLSRGDRALLFFDVFDSDAGYAHISRAAGVPAADLRRRVSGFFSRYDLAVLVEREGRPLLYEIEGLK